MFLDGVANSSSGQECVDLFAKQFSKVYSSNDVANNCSYQQLNKINFDALGVTLEEVSNVISELPDSLSSGPD